MRFFYQIILTVRFYLIFNESSSNYNTGCIKVITLIYIYIYYYYFYLEKPQKAALKGTILLGGVRRRGKTGKHRKVGVKRKWYILTQTPIPHKKTGGSHLGWNYRNRPPDMENSGSQYHRRLGGQARLQVDSRYIHTKQE